eukprot:scaffold1054_cov366-Prasinococcus_capsulatus_cf.AAC.10
MGLGAAGTRRTIILIVRHDSMVRLDYLVAPDIAGRPYPSSRGARSRPAGWRRGGPRQKGRSHQQHLVVVVICGK